MASAFFYYPDATGDDLEILDCGVFASDIQDHPIRDATVTVAGTGRYTNVLHGARQEVRIIIELGNDLVTAEKFQTLEVLLKEGATVGFAFDTLDAWLYVLDDLPARGATKLTVGTSVLTSWGSGVVAAADPVVLQSPLLSYVREHNVVSSYFAGLATMTRAVQRTFTDAPVVMRHKWFFPAIMLSPNQRTSSILTHDHGFNWTFDGTFWEDVYSLAQFDHVYMGSSVTGSDGDAFGGPSFESTSAPHNLLAGRGRF